MKKLILISILLIYNLTTFGQCDIKTNNRPDGNTISYFNPKPVIRQSNYEVGIAIYKNQTTNKFMVGVSVLFVGINPMDIKGDLTILSAQEAKEIDLTNYLSSLGHQPVEIRNVDYWYRSPFRNEQEPSFKVNQKLNVWFDHGLGKGGNLIDFGILYHNCSVGELLQKLGSDFSLQQPIFSPSNNSVATEGKIKILGDLPLTSPSLLRYLQERKIPIEIAEQFCREVRYELNNKNYFGIGFKNDSGGYEIRNPYFKTGCSPKDITTIDNGSENVIVFEGFMDFLSFKTTTKNLPEKGQDFVVLNSVSFFERARYFMENHNQIRLYLDRDTTGINCTQRALSMSSKYKDESTLYKKHKDFNEWIVNAEKAPKKRLGRRM